MVYIATHVPMFFLLKFLMTETTRKGGKFENLFLLQSEETRT